MTREEIKDFCDMKAQLEPENEDIFKAIVKMLEQEPKTGHWIDTDSKSFEFHRVYKCSECGNTEIEYPEGTYRHFRNCPNCGAKMEEVEE